MVEATKRAQVAESERGRLVWYAVWIWTGVTRQSHLGELTRTCPQPHRWIPAGRPATHIYLQLSKFTNTRREHFQKIDDKNVNFTYLFMDFLLNLIKLDVDLHKSRMNSLSNRLSIWFWNKYPKSKGIQKLIAWVNYTWEKLRKLGRKTKFSKVSTNNYLKMKDTQHVH